MIEEKIRYWKYLGYTKKITSRFDEKIAQDNLHVLKCLLTLITAVMLLEICGAVLILIYADNTAYVSTNSVITTACTALFSIFILVLCVSSKHQENTLRSARWLTVLALSAWSVPCVLISTVFHTGPAVLMCGFLLLAQVVFNAYPADNLLFVSVIYAFFLVLSFVNKDPNAFAADVMYTVPFLAVGVYLSWVKTRAKFSSFINQNAQAQSELNETEKNAAKNRLAVMLAQLQPHFLFNMLSSIVYLCDEDPAQARETTMIFSEYLRGNIKALKTEYPIPFVEELRHLKAYLTLEKIRFNNKLDVVYNIEADDFCVPAVVTLLLAQNAVFHGLCSKDDGGTLTIASREYNDRFEVIISDNGVGFDTEHVPKSKDSQSGIQGIRARIEAQTGGTLLIQSKINFGTKATVVIPKEEKIDAYFSR
ncbi:MAG TPA: histidine kinase [Bacillota bacterium]|nr:histidine kinase [Bacillota bacterium]